MLSAREVFMQFADAITHLDTDHAGCLALFAPDAVFEFPYAPTLGLPARHEGTAQIGALLELIRDRIPPVAVGTMVIHELKRDGELFVECHSEGRIGGTGQPYTQDYASYVQVENGRIRVLREYFNAISSARAILPGGLADVPAA